MNSHYFTPAVSDALLLTCSALGEVGMDNEADLFRKAIFDRTYVDQARQALNERAHNPLPEDSHYAMETACRLLQRLDRLLNQA